MSRYRGPKLRISRRLNLLPGLTLKKSAKQNPPGKSKSERTGNTKTDYGRRLEEKQKLKFNYGLTEKQLFRYVKEARRRKGVTGLIMLQLLEMRLDTLCYMLGFANTIAQARQLVNHGHITVNKNVVSIPSFQCRLNDVIGVKGKSTSRLLVENNLQNTRGLAIPSHLKFDNNKLEGTVLNYCNTGDIRVDIKELLVIEHYSRR